MTLHLGYPTVTQGHWLTGLIPVARPNKAHMSHPCSHNQTELTCLTPVVKTIQTQHLTRPKPTIPPLIMWKVHIAHDCEHGYHDSLHSAEVAQFYPQVGDSITCRWLRVSILPIIHFLRCMVRISPHSFSQIFPARKHTHWGFTAAEVTSYRSPLLCQG
jgi:hypothetical protein